MEADIVAAIAKERASFFKPIFPSSYWTCALGRRRA